MKNLWDWLKEHAATVTVLILILGILGRGFTWVSELQEKLAELADQHTTIDAPEEDARPHPRLAGLVARDVPIGSIIAWHKTGTNVPGSDVGAGRNWMECNGDKVTDEESPLYGQSLPDLNGERRFLRGDGESGRTELATAIPVFSEFDTDDGIYIGRWITDPAPPRPYSDFDEPPIDDRTGRIKIQTSDPNPGAVAPRAVRVRPINMSVVWIMRVK